MIIVKLIYIHTLTLLLLFGCHKEETVETGQLMLSPGEYATFRASLTQTRGKNKVDSILSSYLAIYAYAEKHRYDTCTDFIRQHDIQQFFALSQVNESMSDVITRGITRINESALDTVKEFISKQLKFVSIASFDFDHLKSKFEGSEDKALVFDNMLRNKAHPGKLIIREYTSSWPAFIPPGDYQVALMDAKEGEIIGPVQSDDVVSYLKVTHVSPVRIDHISADSLQKVGLKLKKIRLLNSVIGKFLFESKMEVLEDAPGILMHYLQNYDPSKPGVRGENDKEIITYLKDGLPQSISLRYFLKFHSIDELLSMRENKEKLVQKISNFGRRQLLYEFAVKNGVDTLQSTKYQDQINYIMGLSDFTIHKIAKDSLEHDRGLVFDYYSDHIENYTAHTSLIADQLIFSDMDKCRQAYMRYKDKLFHAAQSKAIDGLISYNPQVKFDYDALAGDPTLQEILFFYKKGISAGSVKVREDITGKVHMYYVLEKSGSHKLPFPDIEKVVENDLLREMSKNIIIRIRGAKMNSNS